MMFLYDYPNWLMGLIVVGTVLVAVLTSYFIFRKIFHWDFSESQISSSMGLVGIIATIVSLLLAFSAVSVWDSFNDADNSVTNEANDGSMLARDLASFGGPEATKTRAALKEYLQIVVNEEWPAMQQGGTSEKAWKQLNVIFEDANAIESKPGREQVILGEIWQRINELTKHRRDRIHASQSEVPQTLWTVVLLGTALTFLFTFVMPVTRFHLALISGLALAMGLVFFFIVAMDHPFAGKESIGHDAFDSTITNMTKWDENVAAAKAKP